MLVMLAVSPGEFNPGKTFLALLVGTVLLGVLLSFCSCQASLPGPQVATYTSELLQPEEHQALEQAPLTWRPLGYKAIGYDGEPATGTIWVEVLDWPAYEKHGALALAILEIDLVLVDFMAIRQVSGWWNGNYHYALQSVMAHELGHIILDTANHLPVGVEGVMSPTAGGTLLSPADFDFACLEAGRCLRY